MNVSEPVLAEQLRALFVDTTVPDLEPQEFSPSMYGQIVGAKRGLIAASITEALRSKRIKYVGERLTDGKRVKAYRFTTPEEVQDV
ncbi:MAG: hypothetical protein WC718_17800 [Phycisphaerales bacterium]